MLTFLFEFLFPEKPLARELLRMGTEEFRERARKTESRAGGEIISLFDYSDPLVKEAVWFLKYRGNKKIAALLAALIYDELLGFLEEYAPLMDFRDPLLIPLPLSRKRLRERGFNQCKLLTTELEHLDKDRNFSVGINALRKIIDTPSQTKTESRKEREKNLKDCFAADATIVSGRNIILIDDVSTTGATIEEAKKTLLHVGARRVLAFTIAH